ncbi:class I SAM-dependent methyltransferase [Pseudoxanthomonas sp.]|uniref:class I SAM-dependent methyltransferase n=1 Tax=Pseudoxanthomonas sp. TaxID=1871049 RepID=UPI0026319E32|nr:class I SAM-dependent methyltransferase [Pseudoxanthomonas sp.]WDS36178.1 MAG: class I SAM-dependent methyltransferase [Pseudoxanthomonas sp.]
MALNSTERFTSRVADYVRYRPDYPTALVDWLHRELQVPAHASVADIGAGTGISCKLFLDAGHPVTAVEPNAAMRAAAEDWLGGDARFATAAGTAEATSLADASVDLVTAAQAFHWFDQQAVKAEWRRILRPGGLAVVFWNSRRLAGTPFLEGYEQLLLDYGLDYSSVSERYNDDASMEAWFDGGLRGMARFDHGQQLDFDALRGRLLSSSYAPQEGHPRYAPMLAALQVLFDATAIDGKVGFDYDTRAFAGTLVEVNSTGERP